MAKAPEDGVTIGTENVFADLALPNADERLAKAKLALAISAVVQDSGLTQAHIASKTGLTQPQVSSLVRGRLSGFTLDRLFRVLNSLGQSIEIVVSPSSPRFPASVTVSTNATRRRKKSGGNTKLATG